MAEPNAAAPVRVIEEMPAYWRVVFDYPPFNIVDADVFQALQDLLVRMDTTESLRVVVFESAIPDFYLAHFDLTGKLGNIMTAIGASGLPILMDTFVRLTKSPVVSIAKIRGCARGVSSEFVLACDMRFASRENTRLGHPELGVGLHPGGGGTERPRAQDRLLRSTSPRRREESRQPGFVAAGRQAPRCLHFFWGSADQHRIQAVLERGLQRDTDFEKRWPEVLGNLVETDKKGMSR